MARLLVGFKTLLNFSKINRQYNSSPNVLLDVSAIYKICRSTSFFNKLPAEDLWRGVTSVSNAGKKRGRGKGIGKKVSKDLNKGQSIGVGTSNLIWPGLNSPVVRGREIIKQQFLGEDVERVRMINRLRDSSSGFRISKLHPIDRGWSGSKMPGRAIGPPDKIGEENILGFDTKVLENKIVFIMKGNMGRKRRYSVFSVTGNGKGLVGTALAKAPDMRTALRKSKNRAGQKLMSVQLYENRTIFHDFHCAFGKTEIFVTKKPKGYGLVCHRAIQTISNLVGIQDIHARIEGSTSLQHIVKAFLIGLLKQKNYGQIAEEKQLHIVEFSKENANLPNIIASPNFCRKSNELKRDEVLDFQRYVLQDKIILAKHKTALFYENTDGYSLYLKKKLKLRKQDKVRLNIIVNKGGVFSDRHANNII